MEIAIIAPEFHPFVENTGRGQEAAELAEQFSSLGHGVKVLIPYITDADWDGYSLAKRLVPITVEVDGTPQKAIRYDGRTLSGLPIHFLEFPALETESRNLKWSPARIEAFGKAASSILEGMDQQVDVCIAFGGESSCVPAAYNRAPGGTDRPAQVLVVNDTNTPTDPIERGIGAADRVVLADGVVEASLRKRQSPALLKKTDLGHAFTLKRPCPAARSIEPADSVSRKTTFQMKKGLAVRVDVPLVCFVDMAAPSAIEALEGLLTRDVQVVVLSTETLESALHEQYRDRLVRLDPKDDTDEAIAASDICVAGDDDSLAIRSASLCTLPMVGPGVGDGLVDLEPSCKTGSAIVLTDLSKSAFDDGWGRMESAFANREEFYRLLRRLPDFGSTWQKVAGHYLQIIDGIQLQ